VPGTHLLGLITRLLASPRSRPANSSSVRIRERRPAGRRGSIGTTRQLAEQTRTAWWSKFRRAGAADGRPLRLRADLVQTSEQCLQVQPSGQVALRVRESARWPRWIEFGGVRIPPWRDAGQQAKLFEEFTQAIPRRAEVRREPAWPCGSVQARPHDGRRRTVTSEPGKGRSLPPALPASADPRQGAQLAWTATLHPVRCVLVIDDDATARRAHF